MFGESFYDWCKCTPTKKMLGQRQSKQERPTVTREEFKGCSETEKWTERAITNPAVFIPFFFFSSILVLASSKKGQRESTVTAVHLTKRAQLENGTNNENSSSDTKPSVNLMGAETQFYSNHNYSLTQLPSYIYIVTSALREKMKFINVRLEKKTF